MLSQETPTLALCIKQAQKLSADFRLGHHIAAQRPLPDLILALLERYPSDNLEQVKLLRLVVQAIREAQERQDWLGLADYLEYELVQILSQVLATTNQHGVS